jgi:hypothetical protein
MGTGRSHSLESSKGDEITFTREARGSGGRGGGNGIYGLDGPKTLVAKRIR